MATPEYAYTRTNEITLTAFGPSSNTFAAEISGDDGHIWLWIMEPQARADQHGQRGPLADAWDEYGFRDAVRAVVAEVFGPASEAPQDETFTLCFDPGSDQIECEEVER